MPEDIVRVLRIYEFSGPRGLVESQVEKSIHGRFMANGVIIKAATIGCYPEVLEQPKEKKDA